MANREFEYLVKGLLSGVMKGREEEFSIKKELYKDALRRNAEMGDYKQKETWKREQEQQDPYKQSQLSINQEILKSIRGGGATGEGGDLIYRDPSTGQEVPQTEALQDIQEGKQFIIKRRVTTRQGIKEEDVAKPKEFTDTEIKTLSGAEEVLNEINDLEAILKAEPSGRKATIPFFGKSAQAQGVKIPGIAPYGISEKGQEYRTLRESINNRLLYLRSGAQINDKEYRRLSGMLPEIFRADKVDLQQLQRFKNEFGIILNRMKTGKRGMGESIVPKSKEDDYSKYLQSIGQ